LEKAAFVYCIGSILNDENVGEALFRGFQKGSPDRLTFKEYAGGVGKLTKGNMMERLGFVFRMYQSGVGKVDEQRFVDCTKSLYRFTNGTKVSVEVEQMMKNLFKSIAGSQPKAKITYQMYSEGLLRTRSSSNYWAWMPPRVVQCGPAASFSVTRIGTWPRH